MNIVEILFAIAVFGGFIGVVTGLYFWLKGFDKQ